MITKTTSKILGRHANFLTIRPYLCTKSTDLLDELIQYTHAMVSRENSSV